MTTGKFVVSESGQCGRAALKAGAGIPIDGDRRTCARRHRLRAMSKLKGFSCPGIIRAAAAGPWGGGGWRRAVGSGPTRTERPARIAARSRRHYPARPGPSAAGAAWRGGASPAFLGLIAAGAGGVLAVPVRLYGSARRTRGRTALRQAEGGTFRTGPAFPLVADRDCGEGQDR